MTGLNLHKTGMKRRDWQKSTFQAKELRKLVDEGVPVSQAAKQLNCEYKKALRLLTLTEPK
ncbi:hypothetical protein K5M76_09415 [Shewanella xiamenensis]|uniref:hypothetical protein n=1 Tax=Shewanella xiamenensis TaxID=332186 RepID=UPI00217D4C5E|nr:hypothetical protein [Shewanella xiamenensis]MCT8857573.1 hypothetical protein [Shewanella xiamenensis]UWG66408.1 hypothetical protein K5M76_09415 [Shewanella xiamenensis]